jgi:hypothetical protein
MRVRVSDPGAVLDLAEFLRARVGAIVQQTGGSGPGQPAALEVSLLGSYSEEALRGELDATIRRWAISRGRPDDLAELL